MEKLKSSLLNMVLSLTIISIVMSAALGFVYVSTKDKIEKAKNEKILKAIKFVMPEFNNNPLKDTVNFNGMIFYQAKKDSVPVGYSVKVNSFKGFKGNISLMVGFLPDGDINNISVLDQKETPGLGSKISNQKFINQYLKKNLSDYKCSVKKDGGDVDAITGATVSSRAFCDAVQIAYSSYIKNICKKEINKNPSDTCNIANESIIKLVLPGFDNHPLEKPQLIDETVIYNCTKHDKLIGYAIKTFSTGYHSSIWILAGFLTDGTINKIIVLKQNETEGLGAEVTSEKFLNQFEKKNPDKFKLTVKNDGGEVDAISGATISSRAFCDAVNKAFEAIKKLRN